jgi:LysM repeat protein
MLYSRLVGGALTAAALSAFAFVSPAQGQSLRGSPASVNRMYHQAKAEDFSFFETSAGVRKAVKNGWLVKLEPNGDFTLHEVGYPYVRPMTKTFVERLAPQYRDACGETLEVTSAVRPATRQPPNSVARSVHPTGMAVDLHKPHNRQCLQWLRSTLLDLEDAGVLEATEEFSPPHFHVAVFVTPYTKYVADRTSATDAARRMASSEGAESVYRVRPGDTLWDIARAHDTTVAALRNANHLDDSTIQPGQTLAIPGGL